MIALCFRFSLIDSDFSIYLNGEQVTIDCLKDLADATQFLWIINRSSDSYVSESNIPNLKERKVLTAGLDFSGFIGSVSKPRDLKIMNVDERVGVDLFVNGRLREKNVLKYIPTSQVAESYLYGQLHFDSLDTADVDRFTSSRE